MERGRCYQEIGITDQLAPIPQLTPNSGKAAHDLAREGKDGNPAKEPQEDSLVGGGVSAIVNPFVYLAIGHKADVMVLPAERRKKGDSVSSAFEPIRHPIAIDEVAHSSRRGREGMRRLS